MGWSSYGVVPIFVSLARETIVARNHIHHVPYSGISIGSNFGVDVTGAKAPSREKCPRYSKEKRS